MGQQSTRIIKFSGQPDSAVTYANLNQPVQVEAAASVNDGKQKK